jgi:hypothetical protein
MNTPRLDPGMSPQSNNEQWLQQLPAIRRALLNEQRHIVVSSGSSTVLDEAGIALVRDLLKIPGVKVLSQQPASTDVILQRFNKLLADIPVHNALERDAGRAEAIHVFVVHDGPSIQNSDYTLMARLVSDLPGAHLRLVVIVDTAVSVQERVQAVGRKGLHWAVGPSKRSTQHWLTGEATEPDAALVPPPSFWSKPNTSNKPFAQTAIAASENLIGLTSSTPPRTAPKALWIGLSAAALLAIVVGIWLQVIDQPPPSAIVTEPLNTPTPSTASAVSPRPAPTATSGTGTARVSGTIDNTPPSSPPQASRP